MRLDLSPTSLRTLGRNAAILTVDDPTWIHRRKETITILDDTWFRRQVSVDFSLPNIEPHVIVGEGAESTELYGLPLTLLRKAPPSFLRFDVRDELNRAIALPTREQNARVSEAALIWAAEEAT